MVLSWSTKQKGTWLFIVGQMAPGLPPAFVVVIDQYPALSGVISLHIAT